MLSLFILLQATSPHYTSWNHTHRNVGATASEGYLRRPTGLHEQDHKARMTLVRGGKHSRNGCTCTLHCTLRPLRHCIDYCAHCGKHFAHCGYCAKYCAHCGLFTSHSAHYAHCTSHCAHCAKYCVHCANYCGLCAIAVIALPIAVTVRTIAAIARLVAGI